MAGFVTKKLENFDIYKKYNLNWAVMSFGIENFTKIISDFMSQNENCVNISVGSGNGYIENYLNKYFNKNIICIEPFFDKIILKQFDKKYNDLPEEIKKNLTRPIFDKINENYDIGFQNINLFINWEYPEGWEDNGQKGIKEYGIEAVEILKPKSIIYTHGPSAGRSILKYATKNEIIKINDTLKYKLVDRKIEWYFNVNWSLEEENIINLSIKDKDYVNSSSNPYVYINYFERI